MIPRIQHVLQLIKSQLSLFDYQAPKHEEIHHREGSTRHTASGATVQVAPTMAKVTVRGKEGEHLGHGRKVYYKLPDQPRKKKGTIVGGSHEEGYVIQPVRQGYVLRPPQITAERDQIWTDEEHAADNAPSGTRETTSRGGSTISATESRRRAEVGRERAQLTEAQVLTHKTFVSRMKSTLAHLASSNGFNPHYEVIGGALHNDDDDASELYSQYITAALNSYRTETSKAPEEDLQELRDHLDGRREDSRILMSMARAGKTAALRHIINLNRERQEHDSYDGAMEDDQESGMRAIAGQHHNLPEHESDGARQAQIALGIIEQLEALDDPTAAAIIKMKFGLDRFEHGYKEADIAAALNRAQIPAPDGERWDADQVKERMKQALANLARNRDVQHLRSLLKSLQELTDLRKAESAYHKTVCVDFDGVIADYSAGYQGFDVFGAPLEGAAEAMRELQDAGCKLIIFTTRPDTPALRDYLHANGIPYHEINTNSEQPKGANPGKPIADVYLDDRAVRFTTWGKALCDINYSLQKSLQLYAPSEVDLLMERMHLIKSHIRQYMKQDGTVVQEHDDKRVRKHQDVIAHENAHGDQVHPGSKLAKGEELMASLRGKGWKEKEVHPVKRDESLEVKKKEDLPEPGEIKGANRENSALVSAQRIIHRMHEAAKKADDPVAALTAIHTSRANPYLRAVDDEREKLLAHFGHKVDRDATVSKFEKDGHTVIMDQERVHFAGADPDKAKGQITSLSGRRQVEETDTGKKEPKFILGRPNKAYTAKLNEVKSKYALVEAHDLTTSHTIQGHINRAYPQEIQPRERERLSSQMQMANIMNDIKPELFGHSATAADGAPIVGKDGAVESGNGRTIALSEAYKRGLADKYKDWLKAEAEHFGLKPEDVAGMQAPMLVRLRDDDDPNSDRAEFAREANQSSNLGSSPAEQAWSDAERIDDALLKKFTPDEDGEIYNDDNMEFINGFLAKLGRNEAASLRDADGDPNRKCIERIQNAVFTKVYGSTVLTELQAESAKPRIRNILKALNACVGDFAQVKGHDDLDVVPDMMEAIEYTLSHQNQSREELEHTLRNAGSLNFTGDTPTFKTDYAIEMILAIADRTGSRNRLQNVFKGISHAIKTEVHERENPEVDMFSGPAQPKSKEKVVKEALQRVNSGGEEIRKAQSFQPRGLATMLLKHHGGRHGRERALPTQRGPAEESTAGGRPAGRRGQEAEAGEAPGKGAGQRQAAGRRGEGCRAGDPGRLIKALPGTLWLIKARRTPEGQLTFNFGSHNHDHHAAYNRVSKNGTVSQIQAKGAPAQQVVPKPERPSITHIENPTHLPVGSVLYHGTKGHAAIGAGKLLYLTGDPHEAQAYALGKIPGTSRGASGEPIVRSFHLESEQRGVDINAEVEEALMEGEDIDEVIEAAVADAKASGHDYVTFWHPSASEREGAEDYFVVIIPTHAEKWAEHEGDSYHGTTLTRQDDLRKAMVRSYDRVTPHGALVHVMEHDDHRIRKYGQKLSFSQDSHEVHKLRRERFGHIPHWGSLDDETKLKILDAEEIAAGQHQRREAAKKTTSAAPMAEQLPGDRSGMLQLRMFKARQIEHRSLVKSTAAIANHPGYVRRTIVDREGRRSHRWFRADSPEAIRLGHATRGAMSSEEAMIDAMRRVPVPEFPDTSESNRMTTRRTAQLRQLAQIGNIDAIANFSTSRTRANYAAVDDYKQALLAAANGARNIAPPEETLGAAPAPTTITAANMQNSALLSAQNKINRLYQASLEEDPVAAILAIQTTRSNGYTRAADDYRTLLLRHFGHNSDGTPLPDSQRGENNTNPMPTPPVVNRETATPRRTPRRTDPGPRRTRPEPQPRTNPIPGSANPYNLTEAELGFVPRPDYPLDYYTGREGYWTNRNQTGTMHPYPNEAIRDLARRYIAQDAGLQGRAREYQQGTWHPETPEARAQRQAIERQQQAERERAAREANQRNRQATAELQNKLARSGFKARNTPGNNISEFDCNWTSTGAIVENVMGIKSPEALKHAVGTMFADYGGNITFKIKVQALGSNVSVSASGNDGTSITRYFKRDASGLYVKHDFFRAGSSGDNSGKAFLRASMGLYKVLGVKKIQVYANIDVGGYAWARFGFKANNNNEVANAVRENLRALTISARYVTAGGRSSRFEKLTEKQIQKVNTLLRANNREMVWAIADMKEDGNDIGKALLLGTNWNGTLDMTDAKTMRRFARYVN